MYTTTPMNTTSCPPREKLKDYLAGWSEPEITDAIEAHLAECLSCEQTVVALEADPDTLIEHIRSAPDISSPSDPDINSVLSDARHLIDESPSTGGQANAQPQLVVTEIGAYELVRPLGRGGMGAVYLARHRQLGKQVAIKLLPVRAFRGDHFAARFQREIRAAGELVHVAIVNATDAGQHEGTHYLVMEYIDGLDLSRIARSVGKLSIADACAIMRTIALGLSHAHSVGIVHRDIKPSNMMLSNTGQVKILDFGLAQHNLWDETSAELTTVGQLMGTLDYMAPEQAERADAVDYRADLFSLGATLFRLLCGHAPLAVTPHLSPLAKLRLLASYESPSLDTLRPDAPPELVKLVKALLARDPIERPASAAHVAEQLQAFTAGADLIALIGLAQANIARLPEECFEKFPSAPLPVAPLALATTPDSSRGNKSRWGWLTAAALTPLFLLAGVLITLELQKGQLVIESEAANVSVSLLKDGEVYQQLKIEPGVNTTRLYAGKYQVEIDSGSDTFQIDDRQFTIQKGETTIARIRMVDADKPAAPPEAALAESNRLPSLPETQSIEREILDVEMEREELLSKWGKGHPNLTRVERRLKLLREFAARSGQPTGSTNPPKSELLYEGKTLTQWLDVLAVLDHERSPDAISSALTAVKSLLLPESHQQVSETLLRILPMLDGDMQLKLPGFGRNTTLDAQGFGLLRRATPAAEYFLILARECERSKDLDWSSRILKSCAYTLENAAPNALVDWLQLNVFESKEPHPLLDEATGFYSRLLMSQLEPSREARMLKTLEDCQFLGNDFWLGSSLSAWTEDYKLAVPSTKFAARVCMHAITALDDDETPPKYVVQAIKLLDSVRGSLIEVVGDEGSANLNAALGKRLAELASSENQLCTLVELNSPIDAISLKNTFSRDPYNFLDGINVVVLNNNKSRAVSVAIELLTFIKNMDFDARFHSQLKSIYQATLPATRELYQLFSISNPFRSARRGAGTLLTWPALDVSENFRSQYSAPPTQRQWLSAFIRQYLTKAFPDIVSVELIKELHARKLAWTQSRFAQFDSDMDNQLSVDEFAKLANQLNLNTNFAIADKNDDKTVSVEELFEYFESGSPTQPKDPSAATTSSEISNAVLEFAQRLVSKYDLDGDGVLTANEWEPMLDKPIGADANSDGVITPEELATFRAQN